MDDLQAVRPQDVPQTQRIGPVCAEIAGDMGVRPTTVQEAVDGGVKGDAIIDRQDEGSLM